MGFTVFLQPSSLTKRGLLPRTVGWSSRGHSRRRHRPRALLCRPGEWAGGTRGPGPSVGVGVGGARGSIPGGGAICKVVEVRVAQ